MDDLVRGAVRVLSASDAADRAEFFRRNRGKAACESDSVRSGDLDWVATLETARPLTHADCQKRRAAPLESALGSSVDDDPAYGLHGEADPELLG